MGETVSLALVWFLLATAQSLHWVERSAEAGLSYRNVCGGPEKRFIFETLGSGAAFLDYDEDGYLDLYLVNGAPALGQAGPGNRLFRNQGNGRFRDVTAESGSSDTGFGVAAAAADVDADGDVDLFVANNGPDLLLLNQGDGTFRRAGPESGIGDDLMAGGAAFGDYDRDGFPDLYVANYVSASAFEPGGKGAELCNWRGLLVGCGPRGLPGEPDRLYRNIGGRFQDVSERAGVREKVTSHGLGVLFVDLTGDDLPDIYVANDSRPNYLYVNRGDGTFSEEGLLRGCAYSGEGLEQAGMGVDAADYDGDGDPDLVVTNFSHDHTTLYRNQGRGFFVDASYAVGIGKDTYFPLSWGVKFLDADLDGQTDLFIANGHIYPQVEKVAPESPYGETNQLFLNRGDGTFTNVTGQAGPAFRMERSHRGAAAGDYDNDGRIDLVVVNIDGPAELLHNESEARSRPLLLRLVGVESSRDGLGARVRLRSAGRLQAREVTTGGSYASASDSRLYFALGEGEAIPPLTIDWPSGRKEVLKEPAAASGIITFITIKESAGIVSYSTTPP